MAWKATSEVELWEMLNAAQTRLTVQQSRLWNAIKIDPEKWAQKPWGDQGGGFWVVAIFGRSVLWFNDIEDGFNISKYNRYGEIKDYWCDQDRLEFKLEQIIGLISFAYELGGSAGPPVPGGFPS